MKNILTAMACMMATLAGATTRVVNNNIVPVPPGQFSTISAAITASSAGDTILVTGSPLPYDAVTLNKRLVILGSGYNPKGANKFPSQLAGGLLFNKSANGSVIMGLVFSSIVSSTSGGSGTRYDNITFARNYFIGNTAAGASIHFGSSSNDTFSNINLINNVINVNTSRGIEGDYFNGVSHAQLKVITINISNNILLRGTSTAHSIDLFSIYKTVIIDHNLFMGGTNGSPSMTVSNSYSAIYDIENQVISNNIFYNCYPTRTEDANTQYNNISYAGNTVPLMPIGYAGATGSGNINNTDPQMITLFSSSTNPYLDFNLDDIRLQSGSPCINAGSDGTNIGPTGGLYPIFNTNNRYLTGEPALPSVRQLTITGSSTIPTGGTLNVQVTGKKLN